MRIALTSSMRSNIDTLKKTQELFDATQLKMSTGYKVNSAMDEPSSFFTSHQIKDRANDFSNLLDTIGQAISSLFVADEGISRLEDLVQQGSSIASAALDTPNISSSMSSKYVFDLEKIKSDSMLATTGATDGSDPTPTLTGSKAVSSSATLKSLGLDQSSTSSSTTYSYKYYSPALGQSTSLFEFKGIKDGDASQAIVRYSTGSISGSITLKSSNPTEFASYVSGNIIQVTLQNNEVYNNVGVVTSVSNYGIDNTAAYATATFPDAGRYFLSSFSSVKNDDIYSKTGTYAYPSVINDTMGSNISILFSSIYSSNNLVDCKISNFSVTPTGDKIFSNLKDDTSLIGNNGIFLCTNCSYNSTTKKYTSVFKDTSGNTISLVDSSKAYSSNSIYNLTFDSSGNITNVNSTVNYADLFNDHWKDTSIGDIPEKEDGYFLVTNVSGNSTNGYTYTIQDKNGNISSFATYDAYSKNSIVYFDITDAPKQEAINPQYVINTSSQTGTSKKTTISPNEQEMGNITIGDKTYTIATGYGFESALNDTTLKIKGGATVSDFASALSLIGLNASVDSRGILIATCKDADKTVTASGKICEAFGWPTGDLTQSMILRVGDPTEITGNISFTSDEILSEIGLENGTEPVLDYPENSTFRFVKKISNNEILVADADGNEFSVTSTSGAFSGITSIGLAITLSAGSVMNGVSNNLINSPSDFKFYGVTTKTSGQLFAGEYVVCRDKSASHSYTTICNTNDDVLLYSDYTGTDAFQKDTYYEVLQDISLTSDVLWDNDGILDYFKKISFNYVSSEQNLASADEIGTIKIANHIYVITTGTTESYSVETEDKTYIYVAEKATLSDLCKELEYNIGERKISFSFEDSYLKIKTFDNSPIEVTGTLAEKLGLDSGTMISVHPDDTPEAFRQRIDEIDGVSVEFDKEGYLKISSDNGDDIVLMGDLADLLGFDITATNGSNNRAKYAKQFDNLLQQINELVQDTSYKGINLLNGDDLHVSFNEFDTSFIKLMGVHFDSIGLGLTTSENNWMSNSLIQKNADQLQKAASILRMQAKKYGLNMSVLSTRQNFTEEMINSLKEGADKLTIADINEEASYLLSLQTRQNLATKSLSISSKSADSILELFSS
ncbi:MAG: hypothetical protein MJ250_07715 [Alphaproteobacteria bacterium]|nr:hypothetical protein [Alphaproteobacteria bacterium]